MPQVPGHGSTHLFLIQANDGLQSLFNSHSWRHPCALSYGSPKYPWVQIQDPAPFFSRHSAFGPHGDGKHGDESGVRSVVATGAKSHCLNASPINPCKHVHTGLWFITVH